MNMAWETRISSITVALDRRKTLQSMVLGPDNVDAYFQAEMEAMRAARLAFERTMNHALESVTVSVYVKSHALRDLRPSACWARGRQG